MIKLRKREYTGPSPHAVAIRGRNRSKTLPEHLILERRKQDDLIEAAVKTTEEQAAVDLKMTWEKNTDKRILSNQIQRGVKEKITQFIFALEDRRQELRVMLAEEEAIYIAKAQSQRETIEEKQIRMREKAASLKAKRENERLEIVAQKLDQQWQNQCEELRSVLSRRHQDQVCMERHHQLKQHAEIERERQAEAAMYAELWDRNRLAKAAREEREAQEAINRNYNMINMLQEQRRFKSIQNAADIERVKIEAVQLAVDRDELSKELKTQKEQEQRDRLEYAKSLKKHMHTTKVSRTRDTQEELALDIKVLLQAEADDLADQLNAAKMKEQRKLEDSNYRVYLREQQHIENEKEREIERVIQQDVESQEAKQTQERLRKKEARAAYLQEVLSVRKSQVADRQRERDEVKAETQRERVRINKIMRDHAKHQSEEHDYLKARNVKYASHLLAQKQYTQRLKKTVKDLDQKEYEDGLRTEQAYESRLREVLDRTDIQNAHPLRKKAAARGESLIFRDDEIESCIFERK